MKKQKVGLNKLSLTKSRIAELNRNHIKGGNQRTTTPDCIFVTGYYGGCDVTSNCNTENHCGATNACETNDCASNGCDPTQTQQLVSCYELC